MTQLHEILVSHLVGGAAVIAIRLSAAAKRRGIACTAWVTGDGPAAAALDAEGIPHRQYDLDGMRAGPARQVAACLRMVPGLMALERPLVHVHNPIVFALLRPALMVARAKAIAHFHLEPSPEEIAWTLSIRPAHIVTCARYIAAAIDDAQRGRPHQVPVTAIPNAIELDKFAPGDRATARSALGLDTDRFVILMIANLAPHKGQSTALRATALLASRGMPVECWLVGSDRIEGSHQADELKRLCGELRIDDRVRFLGFRQDAPVLLRAADAFLLPSTREGLPLSILEAQAVGVPVVASTIPGVREVVADGKTGFLVPAEDVQGYADRLWTIYQHREVRERLTSAAAAFVAREHVWSVFEDRVFDVYREVLNPRRVSA